MKRKVRTAALHLKSKRTNERTKRKKKKNELSVSFCINERLRTIRSIIRRVIVWRRTSSMVRCVRARACMEHRQQAESIRSGDTSNLAAYATLKLTIIIIINEIIKLSKATSWMKKKKKKRPVVCRYASVRKRERARVFVNFRTQKLYSKTRYAMRCFYTRCELWRAVPSFIFLFFFRQTTTIFFVHFTSLLLFHSVVHSLAQAIS